MAEEQGTIRTTCRCCGANITPIAEHRRVTVKLNGTGGVWPAVTVGKKQLIRAAFAKNGGALAELPTSYRLPDQDPQPGMQYIAYMQFWIQEEAIPEE
jgi:hypothetical protein